jgi:hypothetical protein
LLCGEIAALFDGLTEEGASHLAIRPSHAKSSKIVEVFCATSVSPIKGQIETATARPD